MLYIYTGLSLEFLQVQKTIQMKRYNIYSCFSIKYNGVELCFDPAKIQKEDLDAICPDAIFISHESMDHMDPIQVYALQKKKNCKIYCSIATAVDLIQFFSCDTDFKEHINTLIPGAEVKADIFSIVTEKSIHCDYMMPIVFKIVDNIAFSLRIYHSDSLIYVSFREM
jgi:L-ascorbate metabolism protein UlaG (beta-lactamase superfamily)